MTGKRWPESDFIQGLLHPLVQEEQEVSSIGFLIGLFLSKNGEEDLVLSTIIIF